MEEVKQSRRDRSAVTRRRILDAARTEFLERGYQGATLAAIAKRAGVAVQTLYFVFHTKAELISAVIDAAVMGDDAKVPEETEWWQAMAAEASATGALRIFVRGAASLFERASSISEILRSAVLTDDEVRQAYEKHERLRATAFREVVALIAEKGRLKDGLDVDTATDVFLTLYGDSTYHQFRVERGWDQERLIAWYCETLPTMLLAPE